MDELAVYTRALSAKEVAEHYQAAKPAANQTPRETHIYQGQDQLSMEPSFFKGIFPEAQPVDMKSGEHLEFYDKPLPADRSNSFWGLNRSVGNVQGWKRDISEKTVYDALLRDMSADGTKQWEIGIGKAGQLYSWRGGWGEAIPPQFMPWTDEVWQATSFSSEVQTLVNKLDKHDGGPSGNGFIQAGATSCEYPPACYTFYSPMLARWYDSKDSAYYVLNWGPHPFSPLLVTHKVLYFTRYKYLGDGVPSVTTASYNFGTYTYGRNGIPWGGVRTSTYPVFFVSKRDGSYKFMKLYFGENGCNFDRSKADGWLGASASKNNPNAQTFGFVFGRNSGKKVHGDWGQVDGGGIGVGRAGHTIVKTRNEITVNKRDYTVMASNVNGTQLPGRGFWLNYYLMVGPREEVIKNARKYTGKVYTGDLNFTEQDTGLTPLYMDSNGLLTRQKQGDAKPACRVCDKPINDSQSLFCISEVPAGGKSMVTTDPYAMSYKTPWKNVLPKSDPQYKQFNNRSTILPYMSQNTKPLHWTLLGFVIPTDKTKLHKSEYIEVPGIDTSDGEPPVLARK